ncbi:MAG TPA: hypothetical protein VE641_18340, partial [Chthoniobacterales bacterium]|nr:hypothetical protein [Chthoniobacterales bacterium]
MERQPKISGGTAPVGYAQLRGNNPNAPRETRELTFYLERLTRVYESNRFPTRSVRRTGQHSR